MHPLTGHRAPRRGFSRSPRALALLLALLGLALTTTAAADPASSALRPGLAPATIVTTYRLTPKVQRTVRFTGYATYSFHTRPKRRIVSATARIVGAQAHAVKINATSVSRNHKRFTVKLIFPGEQGNPGRLVVRLGTVRA